MGLEQKGRRQLRQHVRPADVDVTHGIERVADAHALPVGRDVVIEAGAAVVDEDIQAASELGGDGLDGFLERGVGREVRLLHAQRITAGGGLIRDFFLQGSDGIFALGDGAAADDDVVGARGLVDRGP